MLVSLQKKMLTSKRNKTLITLQNTNIDREQHYNIIKQYNLRKHKTEVQFIKNKRYSVTQQY